MGIFMHDPVKVLVVANKDDNLIILDALFKDLNCEVIKKFSGNEALKMCLKYEFACIISALDLLDMSGFEITKTLCSHERTVNVPVVLLSDSVDDESTMLKAYEVGAVDFILKPVKPYVLIPKIKLFIKLYQQRQTLQQQIEQLDKVVHFDPLTHLYNRRQFKGVLEKTHVIAMRYQRRYALLLINIDDFKKLNDTMGQAFGDKVLAVVGKRLRENTRSSDCVACMGGDNFAVLTPEIKHTRDAGKLANILLDKFKKPFKIDGSEVTLTASIGVVCFPESDNNVDDLLKKSGIALHKAKKKGKSQFQFFAEHLNQAYIEYVKMCSALDSAIQKNEMFLCYQPQIHLKSGKVVGLEVLARWHHSELGDIPPNVFIPLAEETGFIESFGFWVLKEACEQYATWNKSALLATNFLLSINISPEQLKLNHFLKELLASSLAIYAANES
jgi:diguanylate cyclase (GGDEF)-like protein